MKGKAYFNRKSNDMIPKGDLYHTPKSLVWVAEEIIESEFDECIFEPCAGNGAISEELTKLLYPVFENDLYSKKITNNQDYLLLNPDYMDQKYIITNPPFSLWDEFVLKAKTHCEKFMFIGRLNYFGTYARYKNRLFDNLKWVLPFNRYVDYRTPYREDGHFYVGGMATGWFLWDMDYQGKPMLDQLDVQKYATLGGYKE